MMFWALAAVTGVSAVLVVVSQNIVRAAIWLLFALGGTSGIFFLLGADFVGATQLIVYVGGTLVLVVFGVMLTAQGPFISMKTGVAEWAVAALVGLLFLGVLATTLMPANQKWDTLVTKGNESPPDKSMSTVVLGEALLGIPDAMSEDAKLTGIPPTKKDAEDEEEKKMEVMLPKRHRVSYLLPFEIVSVHLLVVLVGAAYLARAKRRRGANPT